MASDVRIYYRESDSGTKKHSISELFKPNSKQGQEPPAGTETGIQDVGKDLQSLFEPNRRGYFSSAQIAGKATNIFVGDNKGTERTYSNYTISGGQDGGTHLTTVYHPYSTYAYVGATIDTSAHIGKYYSLWSSQWYGRDKDDKDDDTDSATPYVVGLGGGLITSSRTTVYVGGSVGHDLWAMSTEVRVRDVNSTTSDPIFSNDIATRYAADPKKYAIDWYRLNELTDRSRTYVVCNGSTSYKIPGAPLYACNFTYVEYMKNHSWYGAHKSGTKPEGVDYFTVGTGQGEGIIFIAEVTPVSLPTRRNF